MGSLPPALFAVPVRRTETDERFTPRWVFDGLGLHFDLDPCAPLEGGDHVPTTRRYTRAADGLAQTWHGLVWVNPPFSNAAPWARRFTAHGNGLWLGPVANGAWWQELAATAHRLWLCADFAFDSPTHAGKRSAMPLAFAAMGATATEALDRLAHSGRHRGLLVALTGFPGTGLVPDG